MSKKSRSEGHDNAAGISVKSLGSSLSLRQRTLWKNLERRLFAEEPYYILTMNVGERGEETEFFILYDGDLAVGRATASVNRPWIEKKGHNLGFINDLMISPDHKEHAGLLIERCLDSLKARGVEGAIVRYQSFPALADQELGGDVPPYCLPGNPPWYIDLFEKKGFIRYKEWANYRMKLPPRVSKDETTRVEESVKNQAMSIGKIRLWSRRELDEYHDLNDMILWDHLGYTPDRFLKREDRFVKHLAFVLVVKLMKFRIYVMRDPSGRLVGCGSFAPNINVALRPFMKRGIQLWNLPRLLISVRRVKRAEISTIGFVPEMRGKGFVRLMDTGIKAMVDAGYKELDTGPIMADNRPVIKMVGYLQKKYGVNPQHLRYHTLLHWFKDTPQTSITSPQGE